MFAHNTLTNVYLKQPEHVMNMNRVYYFMSAIALLMLTKTL